MDLNQNNRGIIQFQINQKMQYDIPFYATQEFAQSTLTDMDEFPYKRFYRGVYNSSTPIVFEREAGWRPLHNNCYKQIGNPKNCEHPYCWQYPCSTVYPCHVGQEMMKQQGDMGDESCGSQCNVSTAP